ncbi:MAG: tRNA1(Val) (adenine(37)-N6)-methyltransferase [Lachnospiraceae bacterium]|nr:tRNA1(Val) (adenine(37)-N6)-methyltransferase [Lachnospiraceae bacterium]
MTEHLVYPYERVDDLQRKGYRIIQNPDWFCFGMDAVLLSAFAAVKPGETVLDMGTGTGVIPILMEARTKGSHFTGLEIQKPVADMALRSVHLNQLEEKVSIVNGDIKEASSIFGRASFDIVTCNPPYMDNQHGLQNPSAPKAIARHEVLCTFEDVAREASACLRPGGRFYLVHRPRRLMDLLTILRSFHLEPKRMRFVHPFVDREANMVLIEAFRGGGVQMHIEPPLVVYQDVNIYTDEVKRLYYTDSEN